MREAPNCSLLGSLPSLTFQLMGPISVSFHLSVARKFGFRLVLGALRAEMDACYNDSCLGPHSHQHVCGEDEEG